MSISSAGNLKTNGRNQSHSLSLPAVGSLSATPPSLHSHTVWYLMFVLQIFYSNSCLDTVPTDMVKFTTQGRDNEALPVEQICDTVGVSMLHKYN